MPPLAFGFFALILFGKNWQLGLVRLSGPTQINESEIRKLFYKNDIIRRKRQIKSIKTLQSTDVMSHKESIKIENYHYSQLNDTKIDCTKKKMKILTFIMSFQLIGLSYGLTCYHCPYEKDKIGKRKT